MKENNIVPNIGQLESELARENYKVKYRSVLRSTVYILIVVAAVATLAATIFLPVLRVYGDSMEPNVNAGDIVVAYRSSHVKCGDVVAVYYGNKLMIKRCIACPGQTVSIDQSGNVAVNGEVLQETYLTSKALGDCDLSFPYQVPENSYFLMGDRRTSSVDSRNSQIGCYDAENIVGILFFRVWPLESFGGIK